MQNKPFLLFIAVFFLFSTATFAQSDTCKVGLNTNVLKVNTTKSTLERAANNIVRIENNCLLDYGKLEILSRWGEVLFEEENTNKGFDGIIKGKALAQGVYIYRITYRKMGESKKLETSGQLMVIKE